MANDFWENAVESIKENVKMNNVEGKVRPHFGDAIMTIMTHRTLDKRFHAVDLDPSSSLFLDSPVQSVADNEILIITCTDFAVLYGNTPEASSSQFFGQTSEELYNLSTTPVESSRQGKQIDSTQLRC
ncbi:unnamed protein product [Caenorhabditis angaria]|uniref:tRNA (guanine(26)-N(2))-dimethyltransferase n=1 Tax=Caenorhabditis angaria TaxID=860376 RepID=A0A9P1N7C7_9PELO|nr:unnamed protein product [Caenorhabditis angaria]